MNNDGPRRDLQRRVKEGDSESWEWQAQDQKHELMPGDYTLERLKKKEEEKNIHIYRPDRLLRIAG